MHIADALSRAHLSDTTENDSEEIKLAVHTLTKHIPVSEVRIQNNHRIGSPHKTSEETDNGRMAR